MEKVADLAAPCAIVMAKRLGYAVAPAFECTHHVVVVSVTRIRWEKPDCDFFGRTDHQPALGFFGQPKAHVPVCLDRAAILRPVQLALLVRAGHDRRPRAGDGDQRHGVSR